MVIEGGNGPGERVSSRGYLCSLYTKALEKGMSLSFFYWLLLNTGADWSLKPCYERIMALRGREKLITPYVLQNNRHHL